MDLTWADFGLIGLIFAACWAVICATIWTFLGRYTSIIVTAFADLYIDFGGALPGW